MISLYCGMSIMICLLIAVFILVPSDKEVPNWIEPFSECIHAYYFGLCFIIIPFGVSLCIHIFKKYGINYTYIFEIDA
jgi:hypothetical protein